MPPKISLSTSHSTRRLKTPFATNQAQKNVSECLEENNIKYAQENDPVYLINLPDQCQPI
jgi:hypothetical protein